MSLDPSQIEVGRVGKPVGLRGRFLVWLNDPSSTVVDDNEALLIAGRPYTVTYAQPRSDCWEIGVEGVTSREDAEKLTHKLISVPREKLAADEFYVEDLRGMAVQDASGRSFGRVLEITWAGPRAMLEVGVSAKDAVLVPVDGPFILRVEAGTVVVDSSFLLLADSEDTSGDAD